jgi:hypothetical protein
MAARYFVHLNEGGDDGRQELSDVGRMAAFMRHPQYRYGELFVSNFSGVKIKYDAYTGDVSPVSTEERVWITYVFSSSAFQAIIAPVKEAISLLAKMELLLALAGRDQAIAGIVQKRHGQPAHLTNITLSDVEKTYRQIVRLVAPANDRVFPFGLFSQAKHSEQPPLYPAIHTALKQYDFYEIESQHEVDRVINQIESSLHQPASPRQSRA